MFPNYDWILPEKIFNNYPKETKGIYVFAKDSFFLVVYFIIRMI